MATEELSLQEPTKWPLNPRLSRNCCEGPHSPRGQAEVQSASMCPQTPSAHTMHYWRCPSTLLQHTISFFFFCQVTIITPPGAWALLLQHPSLARRAPGCSSPSLLVISPGLTQALLEASTPARVNTGLWGHSAFAGLFVLLCLQTLSFLQIETCGLHSSGSIPGSETQANRI